MQPVSLFGQLMRPSLGEILIDLYAVRKLSRQGLRLLKCVPTPYLSDLDVNTGRPRREHGG